MEINMKSTMRLLGVLVASVVLVACGGGSGSKPVKTEKVWRLSEKVLPNGDKFTFDYDGSGNIIRQNNKTSGAYVEFNYDDKGLLLTREDFYASGAIKYHIEFDSHGEPKTRAGANLVPTITYVNTYDDDRVVPDEASKRNNTETYPNSFFEVYPASKLVNRVRSGGINWVQKYSYEGNSVHMSIFKSNDLVSDVVSTRTFDGNGNVVRFEGDEDGERGPLETRLYYTYDYTYTYENGNLKSSTLTKSNGDEEVTTYNWKPMYIPIK